MFKILLILAVFLSLGISMTACNTVHGVGKDVERGGQKIQDAAEKHD